MSDGDEHEHGAHDEPLPVSRVRLVTEEDLQRDFGPKKLLIGFPVTPQPPVEDMLVQPSIPDRVRRTALAAQSAARRKARSKEPDTAPTNRGTRGTSDAQRGTGHDEQR